MFNDHDKLLHMFKEVNGAGTMMRRKMNVEKSLMEHIEKKNISKIK